MGAGLGKRRNQLTNMSTFLMIMSLLAASAFAFPQTGDTTAMESVFESDPHYHADAVVPESAEQELAFAEEQLDATAPRALYKIQTVAFASGRKGSEFKRYMYHNICPLAAANMHTCIRCEGPGGTCIEFMKFSTKAQFERYKKYRWVPKQAMATFMTSGTQTSGMINSNKQAFEKALKEHKRCSVVKPHRSRRAHRRHAKRSKAHFVTTTITFGKGKWIKPWMYKEICPLAAKQMLECYRCKGPDGKCVEFQKFASVASFKRYTQFKWLPKRLLTKFFRSGSTTNGYTTISEAAFKHKQGLDCERVEPGE